jgi:L-ascorbate metabolism protein UlaG (beta-lactamase superfamily)
MAKLLYQGHGSLRLRTDAGTVVYVDPYAGEGYELPADLILVTHQHYDHNAVEKPAKKPGCRIITEKDALEGGKYRSFSVAGVALEAVPAENKNHPRSKSVGYLVFADGKSLYFSGDTSTTPEMRALADRKLDYAFLPIDGVYNMDIPEAQECAVTIAAKHTVPIHMKPGKLFDRERAESFQAPGRLILAPGEEIEL